VEPDRGTAVGAVALFRVAQVIPNVPSFSVDDGFTYSIPETISGVELGRIVRVPLGGRSVRGYVVGIRSSPDISKLRDVRAVSGDLPVFDERLLQTLRWAALHYVAPLSAILSKTSPPNLARTRQPVAMRTVPQLRSLLPRVSQAAASGKKVTPQYLVGGGPWGDTLAGLCGPVLAANRSAMVVAPTRVEAERIVEVLRGTLGRRVLFATSSLSAAQVTTAWVRAATTPGTVLVGTREVVLWPQSELALAVIVEEGRRGMKAPQSPTLHAFELLRRRAAVERFSLVAGGPVPTVSALAAGVEVHEPPGRVWSIVEVIDRGEEPPGSGIVSPSTARALQGVVKRQGQAFVLGNRRDYAPAFRCISCQAVRRCGACGAAAARTDACRRCGAALGVCVECGGERFEPLGAGVGRLIDQLRRVVGDDVGSVDARRLVTVGTERDLAALPAIDLGVVIDADGLIFAPHYRAEEDAFRLMARLATRVRRGSGNRCVVQTSHPHQRVIDGLRSGHPGPFMAATLDQREMEGFPPLTELLAVSLKRAPDDADKVLRALVGDGGEVMGPASSGDSARWLVSAPDLRGLRVRLRSGVQQWRDAGATVRIDADPMDL